jgi:hypothetical protein
MNKNRGHGRPNPQRQIALPNEFQLQVQLLDGPNAGPLTMIKPEPGGVRVFGIGGFSKHEALTFDLVKRAIELRIEDNDDPNIIAAVTHSGEKAIGAAVRVAASIADVMLAEYAALKNPPAPPAEEATPPSPILLGD